MKPIKAAKVAAEDRRAIEVVHNMLEDIGKRVLPVQAAGCYVPGGRYAHAASTCTSS
jgi:sulfopropanediol 3-dehydrogenase